MLKHKLLFLFIIFFVCFSTVSQVKKLQPLSKFEISFHIGYSRPLLEAYGTKMTINDAQDQVFIDGKRFLVSDNLGTNTGYTVQTYLKYNFMPKGYVKALFNMGYNLSIGIYPGPSDYDFGSKVQVFSLGTGAEFNPLGHTGRLYPGVFGLLRMNLVGGETFHLTGLDFIKVTPRYGYTAGFKLNYSFKKTLGMYLGYSYSYDNLWGKKTGEETTSGRVVPFRDEASPANGLTHDRRIAYWSLYLGMNFFFK
jgi:hypothetical protein